MEENPNNLREYPVTRAARKENSPELADDLSDFNPDEQLSILVNNAKALKSTDQTLAQILFCDKMIKVIDQNKESFKKMPNLQKTAAVWMLDESLCAAIDSDTQTSQDLLNTAIGLIKLRYSGEYQLLKAGANFTIGAIKGIIDRGKEWTAPLKIVTGLAQTALDGIKLGMDNEMVPDYVKGYELTILGNKYTYLFNEEERAVRREPLKQALADLGEGLKRIALNITPEDTGHVAGAIVMDAFLAYLASKILRSACRIPILINIALKNLKYDFPALMETIMAETQGTTRILSKIEKLRETEILKQFQKLPGIAIPEQASAKAFCILAEEAGVLNANKIREALLAYTAEAEGFFPPLSRQDNPLIDFTSKCGLEIDFKSPKSPFKTIQGQIAKKTFRLDKLMEKLEVDLGRGHITVFDATELNKIDLMKLYSRVKEVVPESQRHLVSFCFNKENIADFAAEGVTLPRMVKDPNLSPIQFGFYRSDANPLAPIQALKDILNVHPGLVQASALISFNENLKTLYPEIYEKNQSKDIESEKEKEKEPDSSLKRSDTSSSLVTQNLTDISKAS